MNKENKEKLLFKIFYTDKNFDGVDALYKKAKLQNNNIKIKDVSEWLKKQAVKQQTHKKVEKNSYLPIYSETPHAYQIDLTFLPKYKKQNDGYYILFTAININSRYVYAYYSKKRNNENLLFFLKQFEKQGVINAISGDLEFQRKDLTDFFDEHDINYYFFKADSHKLGIINRFHRTLKEKLESYFIANNTTRWIDIIDDIIKNYNNTYHTGIKIEPAKVNSFIENEIVQEKKQQTKEIKNNEIEYNIGDKIRVKNTKEVFDKNKATYSAEVYIISKVNSNSVRAKYNNEEFNFKKSRIFKIDEIENINSNSNIIKAKKMYKIDKNLQREDLIQELTKTQLRTNPKKKINYY